MIWEPLDIQINALLAANPAFTAEECDQGYSVSGLYTLDRVYKGVYCYHQYQIEALIPYAFPESVPYVKELSGELPEGFEHYSRDGVLCLGVECELLDYLEIKPNILDFFNDIVASFFYSAAYFEKYGQVPYNQRSHGVPGMIEYYKERMSITDERILYQLLAVVYFNDYRGHFPCPCMSGKKLRDCHGPMLLRDMSPSRRKKAKDDATLIMAYIMDKYKTRRK